jgi:hypothetical protein
MELPRIRIEPSRRSYRGAARRGAERGARSESSERRKVQAVSREDRDAGCSLLRAVSSFPLVPGRGPSARSLICPKNTPWDYFVCFNK